MEINIQAEIGTCSEFVDEVDKKVEVSVVISPIKVTTDEESNKVKVITGCNMWKSCHNGNCYYSLSARKNKETQRGK